MESKRIILHIGFPKTGTTFLQKEVFPYLKEVCFIRGFHQIRKIYLSNINYHTILISDEAISGDFFRKYSDKSTIFDFKNKIDLLKELFPNAIILIGYRRHSDFIWSLYKQFLNQGGECQDFTDFFNLKNSGLVKIEDLLFCESLSYLEKKFEKVISFDFELLRGEQARYKLISKIGFCLNLEMPKKINFLQKSNQSISTKFQKNALIFLNKLNRKLNYKLNNNIFKRLKITPRLLTHNLLKKIPSSKISLNIQQKKEIGKVYSQDWDRLKKKLTIK